ncbi:hypothetical protein [Hymenobacter persicinus]|uniref:Uncharacterized protein n=1 Tax=Hymenobacter persicinus TaxID=2025506 RepID=A0A4Q5LHK1_9BACT|nr:hypothetical protein [Hymenobacter persicinus]RYU84316.1 hypothetical protein EWM57_01075 [Hymenobacter persicinus]
MKLSTRLALGLALALPACHKKDVPADPCKKLQLPHLNIRYLEGTGTPSPDTVYTGQVVGFEAPAAPYTSYQWQVGSAANTRTERRFALDFPEAVTGRIPVRLIARRPPSTACFPKDDGVDTLLTTLTLMPRGDLRAPIYGKFQGANVDAPRDTFTVRIFLGPNYVFPNNPAAPLLNYLRNLGKGCQSPSFEVGLRWRGININHDMNDSGCLSPYGKGYLTTRDSLRIEYDEYLSSTSLQKRSRVFLGKRVK